jgi:hypothetical protein
VLIVVEIAVTPLRRSERRDPAVRAAGPMPSLLKD